MNLDGPRGEIKFAGDFFVGMAMQQKIKNVALAGSELHEQLVLGAVLLPLLTSVRGHTHWNPADAQSTAKCFTVLRV